MTMTPLLFVRLGTGDLSTGTTTLYAVLDDARLVDLYPAANDDEGLAKARAIAVDRTVECEDTLAELARRRNATTRKLTPLELMVKLHVVAPLFLPSTYKRLLDDRVAMDFFYAAYLFSSAVAKDSRTEWFVGATLRGTVATAAFDREVFLLVIPGALPGLHIVSRA